MVNWLARPLHFSAHLHLVYVCSSYLIFQQHFTPWHTPSILKHLLPLISVSFFLNFALPLPLLYFSVLFSSSSTQPLHARLSLGPVLGSVFPLKPTELSSAPYPVVYYKGFLYLAKVYKNHLQYN